MPPPKLPSNLIHLVQRWQNLRRKSQDLIVTNLLGALGPYGGNVTFSSLIVALIDVEAQEGIVSCFPFLHLLFFILFFIYLVYFP